MSAPAMSLAPGHIHLPSVHVRAQNGLEFHYEEDLYVRTSRRRRKVERVVRLVVITVTKERNELRETVDELCHEDQVNLEESLPLLLDTDILGNSQPDAAAHMQERAREEFARQLRIARGEEQACAQCGCSQSRACSGGCIWARENLCSRCAGGVR